MDEFNEDIQERFLRFAEKDLLLVNSQHLVGISNNDRNIIGWFNNQPYHTMPLSINMIHNAMVKSKISTNHSISVINDPLPFLLSSRADQMKEGAYIGFQLTLYISFAMVFVSAFYIIFYIKVLHITIKQYTSILQTF